MWFKRALFAASVIAFVFPPCADAWEPKRPHPTELAAAIDRFIEAGLAEKGIAPAPLASDAEFHRRVWLDLAGRIPTEGEVRTFLADTSPDRRAKLVETLLSSPFYIRHMGTTWQNVLIPGGGVPPDFRGWLDSRVHQNTPYNVMVRELLTAPMFNSVAVNNINRNRNFNPNPSIDFNNPKIKILRKDVPREAKNLELDFTFVQAQASATAGFFQANEYKPENLAASTARRFLGMRLECAQCHNHPSANWTRKQFWEFAAFFAGVQAPSWNVQIINNRNQVDFQYSNLPTQTAAAPIVRTIAIPGTDKVVEARFLDGTTPLWKDNVESRHMLAEWVTAPNNPYFARTAVNRLWAHFFGVGIIDPVDDEPSEDNPPSHPELLAELTSQFVAGQYDVKHLIRAITLSRAYQRTSAASHVSQNQPRVFARMAVKGLTPEQFFDSLALATGFHDTSAQMPGAIVPNTPRGDFLIMFSSQEQKTETQTSILQALTLMNGKLVADATNLNGNSRLNALLHGPGTNAAKLDTLFLITLSRLPRPEEVARMLRHVESQPDARMAFADIFWVLLNSSEFRFNH